MYAFLDELFLFLMKKASTLAVKNVIMEPIGSLFKCNLCADFQIVIYPHRLSEKLFTEAGKLNVGAIYKANDNKVLRDGVLMRPRKEEKFSQLLQKV